MRLGSDKLFYPTNLSYNFTLSIRHINSTANGLKTVRIRLFLMAIVVSKQLYFKKRDNTLLK
ncbi:hypothetical protein ENHY17A_10077 [Moraxellaceae bacterium 17A]|nr:hypothetical protein ENHY17A_10077 [Moraxellaceae bacterium 17A]